MDEWIDGWLVDELRMDGWITYFGHFSSSKDVFDWLVLTLLPLEILNWLELKTLLFSLLALFLLLLSIELLLLLLFSLGDKGERREEGDEIALSA